MTDEVRKPLGLVVVAALMALVGLVARASVDTGEYEAMTVIGGALLFGALVIGVAGLGLLAKALLTTKG